MDIVNLKAWEMKEKLINKEISSREIIESHLNRIEEVEESINAFISISREEALISADLVDKKISENGNLGILEGLPIGIKDNIVTKDFKTTAGSKMLENYISPYDGTVVERIKNSGGIILGKTNMDEFAIESSNYDGSATAVATNRVALALGTDTGGSNRQPASHCNIVGIKPSYGLVSRYGLISLANTFDQIGTVGRDVKDAALLLECIYGYDNKDLTTSNMKSQSLDMEIEESTDYLKGKKIGLPKELFSQKMDPVVKEEINKSIKVFEDSGAIIEEVSLPSLEYALEVYHIITAAEISSNLARFDGIKYGYRAEDYKNLDELYINTRTKGFGDEVKRRILLGNHILSGENRQAYYEKAIRLRSLIIQDFKEVFSEYDILLSPTEDSIFTVPVNIAGLCAMSIPTNTRAGLSIGLQIIGDRFRDMDMINTGLAYERLVK